MRPFQGDKQDADRLQTTANQPPSCHPVRVSRRIKQQSATKQCAFGTNPLSKIGQAPESFNSLLIPLLISVQKKETGCTNPFYSNYFSIFEIIKKLLWKPSLSNFNPM